MIREPEEIKELNDMFDMLTKLSEIFRLEVVGEETPDQKFVFDLAEKVVLSDDPNTYKYTTHEKKKVKQCWDKYATF
jgi:hypothetical protein